MIQIGFWALVVGMVLRAGSIAPALVGRRPTLAPRLAVAGMLFALFVANTVVTARRVRSADQETAVRQVWLLGGVGLTLAAGLLWLL